MMSIACRTFSAYFNQPSHLIRPSSSDRRSKASNLLFFGSSFRHWRAIYSSYKASRWAFHSLRSLLGSCSLGRIAIVQSLLQSRSSQRGLLQRVWITDYFLQSTITRLYYSTRKLLDLSSSLGLWKWILSFSNQGLLQSIRVATCSWLEMVLISV